MLIHALLISALSIAASPTPSFVDFNVSWPSFLARHDMQWRWNASQETWCVCFTWLPSLKKKRFIILIPSTLGSTSS